MAAKLILSIEGVVLHEYALDKERMTIGRKPHNDVVIDNLAVSGEHAAIVTILNDSFLEDLDSTNGVTVNGVAIKKHFLQSNDLIEIGKYKLKYLNEQKGQQVEDEEVEKTMVLRPLASKPQTAVPQAGMVAADPRALTRPSVGSTPPISHDATGRFAASTPPVAQPAARPVLQAASQPATPAPLSPATLQILSGPNAGRELDLVKNLTTLGKPGVQVAVLTRRPHGYFITHVEGIHYPSLNGKVLNEQPHQLNNHDIIELAGVKMEFYLKD